MYQKLKVEYLDGKVEEYYIYTVRVDDNVLRFKDSDGDVIGITLSNVRKYSVG